MTKILLLLLLVGILIRQIVLLRKLVIPTKKSALERMVVIVGMAVLAWITYRYAREAVDYIFATVGVVTFLAMFYTQGVTSDGITIAARGRATFEWNQIKSVRIRQGKNIAVIFYSNVGSPIATQQYSNKREEKMREILSKHTIIEQS